MGLIKYRRGKIFFKNCVIKVLFGILIYQTILVMIRTIFTKLLKALCFLALYLLFATWVFAGTGKCNAFTVKVTGKGQPMLLIPGATCSGDEWSQTVQHYSGQYQCHVFTLAGYAGTAPLPGGPYLETIKKQIEQYIVDQKLNNVILTGHSIGGYLALCIASEMKDHLQKAVVVDAMPFFALTMNPGAPDTFSESKAQAMLATYNQMDDKALKQSQIGMAKFLCRDSTRWDMIATWGQQSDRKTMAYTLTEMMSSDIRKKIAAIQVPVLVLAAYCKNEAYPGYTKESVAETYAEQYAACSTCRVHVADGNTKHFIMYDNPDWYFKELDTFVQ